MLSQMKKIINAILILAIALAVLFETYLLVSEPLRAQQNGQSEQGDQGEQSERKCVEYIQAFMEKRREEFGKFMNDNFRSAKPTSELIAAAMTRYREYRNIVRKEIDDFFPVSRTLAAQAVSQRPLCEKAAEEDFKIMMEMIRLHVIKNAYAKKTTRLLDKYKTINAKLEKLNFNIAQMYGYFGALSQKLPCYAKTCSKG